MIFKAHPKGEDIYIMFPRAPEIFIKERTFETRVKEIALSKFENTYYITVIATSLDGAYIVRAPVEVVNINIYGKSILKFISNLQ